MVSITCSRVDCEYNGRNNKCRADKIKLIHRMIPTANRLMEDVLTCDKYTMNDEAKRMSESLEKMMKERNDWMSMTSELVKGLRSMALQYSAMGVRETEKIMNQAADTIEELSLKLHNSQMERSSQYYNGGWIDVSDRLPNDDEEYLEYFPVIVKGVIDCGTHDGEEIVCVGFGKYIDWEKEWEIETSIRIKPCQQRALAWCVTPEIPQRYKEE